MTLQAMDKHSHGGLWPLLPPKLEGGLPLSRPRPLTYLFNSHLLGIYSVLDPVQSKLAVLVSANTQAFILSFQTLLTLNIPVSEKPLPGPYWSLRKWEITPPRLSHSNRRVSLFAQPSLAQPD